MISTKTKSDENGRVCTKCKQYKLWFNFYVHPNGFKGHQAHCCECQQKFKCNSVSTGSSRKSKYNLLPEEFESRLKEQNYKCKICFDNFVSSKLTHVDHDHKTSVIRGILCLKCNLLLGYAKDDPQILRNAAEYLEK